MELFYRTGFFFFRLAVRARFGKEKSGRMVKREADPLLKTEGPLPRVCPLLDFPGAEGTTAGE